jgi:DNA-binding GntR family transcriptional regulator
LLAAPITNAIFGHPVGDLDAHGEVLSAIRGKDEQRAFDLMRRLLFDVDTEVARAETLPPISRAPTAAGTRK